MEVKIKLGVPQPKQREFMLATAKYVAFGGARGGGKSWAVRWKAVLMCLMYPGIKILIMRRTYPELVNNHINPLKGVLSGVARRPLPDREAYTAELKARVAKVHERTHALVDSYKA